jgi:hypothetical protein
MKTPDEEVSDRIIAKFREGKLLTEKGIGKLIPNLSAGKLTSEDWKLAFEINRPDLEEKNADNSQ